MSYDYCQRIYITGTEGNFVHPPLAMAQLGLTTYVSVSANKSIQFPVVFKTNGLYPTTTTTTIATLHKHGSTRQPMLKCKARSVGNNPGVTNSVLPVHGTLKAVIFDVDGTLCDSDPLHYTVFVELLKEVGFQGGEPISEDFFIEHITGREIEEFVDQFFPEWDQDRRSSFMEEKDARFRSVAVKQLRPTEGLVNLCQWVKDQGLRSAAVTNAPRENAELMISILGLSDFFEILVVGGECERPKPFPDPYLKALDYLKIKPDEAFVFEDSSIGLRSAVAAGMAAVGLTTRNPENALLKAGASFTIMNYNDPKLWNTLQQL